MIKGKTTQNKNQPDKIINWHNVTILIVEDDPLSMRFLYTILKETQAKLVVAENGQDALNLVKQHDHIDLILMDVQLPIMDGQEVTLKIREFNTDIPIHAMPEDRAKCFESGCTDYITKPIDIELLFNKISKYVNK